MDVISRKDARLQGKKMYFTGKECVNGHVSERWVSTCGCDECLRVFVETNKDKRNEYDKRYREDNKELTRASQRRYRTANPDKLKGWRENRKDKHSVWAKEWYVKNKDAVAEQKRLYRTTNKSKIVGWAAVRRAKVANAFPGWADKSKIDSIYKQSSQQTEQMNCEFHVDHIVPISHPLVCGLHWEGNLQILEASENMHKSNVYWPDMP